MKSYNRLKSLLLTLSAIASTAVMAVPQAKAVSFQEQRVNQNQFAVVAVPFGYKEHRLEIIEQIPGGKKCWNESGVAPVQVDLSLLNFDHTDSCRRIYNTNGYTLRLNGQDDRVAHVMKIVENNGELQLVAFHKDPSRPNTVIGKTNGISNGAMKIILNPGWQITKRVHQGQVIEHLYLSGNPGITNSSYSATSSTSVNSNSSTNSTSTSSTVTQGRANTTTPTTNNVDTQVLVDSVEQLYNNVVNPLLHNLSQGNTGNNQ
ncbi:DUF3747 domain-containing protein [Pleurocapsa sp. PCC 7319]|uniref:DUF3747 domain-containing protein n=1 Tax=Pleurocapsa sp. PCC 7319 TaxID=118161 RepID=UPI0003456042|nr:DUF3747 domain-containing protein [Pleurocapsa sp. PCC 7319]